MSRVFFSKGHVIKYDGGPWSSPPALTIFHEVLMRIVCRLGHNNHKIEYEIVI